MAVEYDTQELRRIAARVGSTANAVSDTARDDLKRIEGEVAESLRGETAEALASEVTASIKNLARIESQLDDIRDALLRFAVHLDQIDAELNEQINAK